MLENRSYNRLLARRADYRQRTASLRPAKLFGLPYEGQQIVRQAQFEQQFLTDLMLRPHRLTERSAIYDIPEIDRLVNLTPLPSLGRWRDKHLAFIGMPQSGKSSTLERIHALGHPNIQIIPEPYSQAKQWEVFRAIDPSIKQTEYIAAAALGELIYAKIQAIGRGNRSGTIFIQDRGMTDNATYNRARLLANDFQTSDTDSFHDKSMFFSKLVADGVFVFMQEPPVSIRNAEASGKPHGHVTEEFLSILKEQYLRTIIGLRNRRQPNLFVLDASGTLEQTYSKAIQALFLIFGGDVSTLRTAA